MTLKQQITEDMKTAMRAKNEVQLLTIRMLLAACKQKEVDERIELSDDMVMSIIEKLIKQRKDSIQAYQKAQRLDLADKEQAEITILQAYLPAPLSPEAIDKVIQECIMQSHAKSVADMGKVMGMAKTQLAGKADMALVSESIKKALSRLA